MSLTQSLEELVDVLESKGRPIRHKLRPGLTRAEIEEVLNPLGLIAPPELYELYQWHDGVDDYETTEYLFAELQFISLKEAVQVYHEVVKYYNIVPLSINLEQCFTFATFEGDNCAIYCDPTPVEGLQHPIIDIFEGIFVIYENIEKMAQTVTKWLVSGAYDNTDTSPVDGKLLNSIRAEVNSRIDYNSIGLL